MEKSFSVKNTCMNRVIGWSRSGLKHGITRQSTVFGIVLIFILCGFGSLVEWARSEVKQSAARQNAAEWVTYRSDITRSGVIEDSVAPELFLQWKYTPAHPPKPAWPMPSEELPRMHVDNAYHVAMAEGSVYFGSCVTNKVYAIDAAKGGIRWTFFTQGPVRFAPTVYNGRVYAGSDDGYVYCLDAADGSQIWKYRAGPSDEKVIGNERMISLWPVRTSVLVDNGIAYFAAGVFPYEGLYICALRAEDGSVVWKNDTIGDRAHELDYGGISPHGYLIASQDILYVPSGRAMPAAFDRTTGRFLFYASPGAKRGGVWALLDHDRLISGVDFSGNPHKVSYNAKTGKRQGDVFAWFPGIDMVVTRNFSYILTRNGIYAINRKAYTDAVRQSGKLAETQKQLAGQLADLRKQLGSADEETKKKINRQIDELIDKTGHIDAEQKRLKNSSYQWYYSGKNLGSLILAGDVIIAGGNERVVGINAETGTELWENGIDGKAVGLAFSGGRLVVSTDLGPIYCFGGTEVTAPNEIEPDILTDPYPNDELTETYRLAAEKILSESGIQKGYCLVVDCRQGRLAYELAQRTELQIVALEKNPDELDAARAKLEAAGLLGSRVVVEPWDIETLPDYFANLIVSDGMLTTGGTTLTKETGGRVLRPWGGAVCLSFHENGEVNWRKFVRGELEGAGKWTQQYGDPQNTACSNDELVNGPLGILWFGEPGPQGMVERHGGAQSPVSMNGRLFVEGEEQIMAVDAFNGTLLWKKEIPGAVRVKVKSDSGNLAVTEDGLYVAAHDKCYRLNPATGETMQVYDIPPSSDGIMRRWGYVSVVGDIIYGSVATAMDQEYGAMMKIFFENGQWKNKEDIPEELWDQYDNARKQYPDFEDALMASQRLGLMYRYMTSFSNGGEFTQKNSVTQNLMVSDRIFALNKDTGELLWEHDGKRIANITVALGDGIIFFADSAVTRQQKTRAHNRRRSLIERGVYQVREGIIDELRKNKKILADNMKANVSFNPNRLNYFISTLEAELFEEETAEGKLTYDEADVRIVTALDARTGKKLWQSPLDLTGCGGDKMGAAHSGGLLLFFGNHGNHDAWRFQMGAMKWRRITAVSAENGEVRWSRPLNYRTRPVIVGDKIILEPRACTLQAGETITRSHPITGKQVPWEFLRPGHTCALTSASAHGLFYRSGCTAFYDLAEDRGVTTFGAYRPGCAISIIPACGLLLSPEASAGCTCSYPIRCSVALIRKPERPQPWTVYVTPGAMKPARHFAINFGAVADMKDDEGIVWFGYPNPKTSPKFHHHYPNYGVKFNLFDKTLPGMGYFHRDFKNVAIADTNKPWLFTSGCIGLLRCKLPLIDADAGQNPAAYTVRMGFKALPGDRTGKRVFDIKLQDKIVLENCDILGMSGTADKAIVIEFKNIRVDNDLALELVPAASQPRPDEAPVINFIEVIRENA